MYLIPTFYNNYEKNIRCLDSSWWQLDRESPPTTTWHGACPIKVMDSEFLAKFDITYISKYKKVFWYRLLSSMTRCLEFKVAQNATKRYALPQQIFTWNNVFQNKPKSHQMFVTKNFNKLVNLVYNTTELPPPLTISSHLLLDHSDSFSVVAPQQDTPLILVFFNDW